MEKISAVWFERGRGRRYDALFSIGADNFAEVQIDGGGGRRRAPLRAIEISSRLANTPRRLTFPDGGLAVVGDNDYIDRALKAAGRKRGGAHFWESRIVFIPLLLVLTAAVGVGAINYALPALARIAAEKMPAQTAIELGDKFYEEIQKHGWLEPSQLDEEEIARAGRLFAAVAADIGGGDFPYRFFAHRFEWRGEEAANAFALPSGVVVATDRFLEIAENDAQLIVVFAHEIGHIRGRHTLRQMIQGASTAALAGLIFGDLSGVVAAPILLAHLKYSRDLEREADCFAYDYLQSRGLSWRHFGDILERVASDYAGRGGAAAEDSAAAEALAEYLSSHPATAARADPAAHCGRISGR